MDRYLIIDLQENSVITTNNVAFPDETDGASTRYENLHDAIDGLQAEVECLYEYEAKIEEIFQGGEHVEKCVVCGEYFPLDELEDTSMGKVCDKCKRGIESREGKI